MKKSFLVFAVIAVSALFIISCSDKDKNPSSPDPAATNTFTASDTPTETNTGTYTATETRTDTATQTPTRTNTFTHTFTVTDTATQTPTATDTPVIKIDADLHYQSDLGSFGGVVWVYADGTPEPNATVVVDDLDTPAAGEYLYYNTNNKRYEISGNYFSMACVEGHDYQVSVTAGGSTNSDSVTAPGGLSITNNGITVSWTTGGNYNTVVLTRVSDFQTLSVKANVTSPYTFSPDPRTPSGSDFTTELNVYNRKETGYTAVPFGATHPDNELEFMTYIWGTYTLP